MRLANCYIYRYTPSKSSLKKHKILQKLRSQKDTIIAHPDKGNGIVILNRSDYSKSITKLISGEKILQTYKWPYNKMRTSFTKNIAQIK